MDTRSKGCIRLKKEPYYTLLACGTPEAADRYQQVKCAAAQAVLGAKHRLGAEVIEAVKESVSLEGDLGNEECHIPQPPWESLCSLQGDGSWEERSQLSWLGIGFGCHLDTSLVRCFGHVPPGLGIPWDPTG